MAFKIPKVPPTSNKSVRFPNDMLEEVEAAIRGTDCTFSAFVVAAVRAALDDLAEQEQQEKRPGAACRKNFFDTPRQVFCAF